MGVALGCPRWGGSAEGLEVGSCTPAGTRQAAHRPGGLGSGSLGAGQAKQLQVPAGPAQAAGPAQQRHLLAGPPRGGSPFPGAPRVNHPGGRSRCQGGKSPGPVSSPKRWASALPVGTCSPKFALYTQGQSGASAWRKEQDQGPQLQEASGLGSFLFVL